MPMDQDTSLQRCIKPLSFHWQWAGMAGNIKSQVRQKFVDDDAYFTRKASSLKQIPATEALYTCVFQLLSPAYNTTGIFLHFNFFFCPPLELICFCCYFL